MRAHPNLFLLLIVFGCIGFVILGHEHAWMHPEMFAIKKYVLADGADFSWEDVKNGLNYAAFEDQPRIYRPFSSYFEILDTKFRSWLWRVAVPHPSLSLTLIFSLALSPFFLFKLLRNMKVGANLALGGAA